LGSPKHPPLGAWLAADGGAVDHVAACGELSAARQRVVGIALLTFVPFYNFHAIKFNANTVLTPFWALAIS
jgi:hypothetical protein